MQQCPSCAKPVASDAHFCPDCGANLQQNIEFTGAITSVIPLTSSGTSGSIAAVGAGKQPGIQAGSAMLVVHRGPGEGTEFPLDSTKDIVTIGRAPEADLFFDDVTVSRRHAEIRRGAQGWSIRDVGSLNGTYVNRKRVDDHRLTGGDELQIGRFRFVFLVGTQS
jgi:pSer/pThr/pTyr-binding forkhead associated (FHA) protein